MPTALRRDFTFVHHRDSRSPRDERGSQCVRPLAETRKQSASHFSTNRVTARSSSVKSSTCSPWRFTNPTNRRSGTFSVASDGAWASGIMRVTYGLSVLVDFDSHRAMRVFASCSRSTPATPIHAAPTVPAPRMVNTRPAAKGDVPINTPTIIPAQAIRKPLPRPRKISAATTWRDPQRVFSSSSNRICIFCQTMRQMSSSIVI